MTSNVRSIIVWKMIATNTLPFALSCSHVNKNANTTICAKYGPRVAACWLEPGMKNKGKCHMIQMTPRIRLEMEASNRAVSFPHPL